MSDTPIATTVAGGARRTLTATADRGVVNVFDCTEVNDDPGVFDVRHYTPMRVRSIHPADKERGQAVAAWPLTNHKRGTAGGVALCASLYERYGRR